MIWLEVLAAVRSNVLPLKGYFSVDKVAERPRSVLGVTAIKNRQNIGRIFMFIIR